MGRGMDKEMGLGMGMGKGVGIGIGKGMGMGLPACDSNNYNLQRAVNRQPSYRAGDSLNR